MEPESRIPAELLRRVEADATPVRPLPAPALRSLWVALAGCAVLLVALHISGLRADAVGLGMALSWGAALLEMLAGLALVLLSLREAVPGLRSTPATRGVALGVGILVEVAVAVVTWMGGPASAHVGLRAGVTCFAHESTLGIPTLGLTLFLAVRAYPVRPRWAGVLGGAGSGLLADGTQHLICPVSGLEHVLVWHAGAFVALMMAGWLAGSLAATMRRRRAG